MNQINPNSKLSHLCAKDIAAHVAMNAPVGAKGIVVAASLSQTENGYAIEVRTGNPKSDARMEFRRESKSFVEKAFAELKSRFVSLGVTCTS